MEKNDWKFEILAFIFMCIFVPVGYIIFVIQRSVEFIKDIFDWYEFKESLKSTADWIISMKIKIYKLTHGE